MNEFIRPNWPAPSNINAYTTLRTGGNLAALESRARLKNTLKLPSEPIWIKQTHSTIAIQALAENRDKEADASFTNQTNIVCAILTADCLPILLCNRKGTHVAAIHAGWRGLANGVIEVTLKALNLPSQEWLAWLGPAIGQLNYEVGPEVRQIFVDMNPESAEAFLPSVKHNHWLADLYKLAEIRLRKQGITAILGGEHCTYHDPKKFYSYRRDGQETGRMASLIWISK